MFNTNVDLLAEATGFSAALDGSFLEQYTSLDDMVHEMICESYEDMLKLSKFEHDADMMEAKMIIQQESVQDIVSFQEGVYGRAKNFVKKIIDKIKIRWRKFCIWVNRKVATFLAKRVANMKAKADAAFERRNKDADLPTVKYASNSQDAVQLIKSLNNTVINAIEKLVKTSWLGLYFKDKAPNGALANPDKASLYFAAKKDGKDYTFASKQRAVSYKKDLEEKVLGDIESTEITKTMWNITKDDIKKSCAVLLKSGTNSINKLIKTVEKMVRNTKKFANKDADLKDNEVNSDKNSHADVTAATNAANTIISFQSAAMSCLRKICWMALKAAASARINGGATGDYEDEEDTKDKGKQLMEGSYNYDDLDLSVF